MANVLVPSLQFSVWLRSRSRRRHVKGVAAIWNLYADPPQNRTTEFSVGPEWTQVSVGWEDAPVPYLQTDSPTPPFEWNPNFRVELYLKTINQDLDVDAAVMI
ncbi:hypothetical protein [Kribbella sp. NPDC000426]|uniref:hypothetical protein n=1 Tax=Kribbella sp. NPDC000426 TaxID=3154255 RepID=UPI003325683F